MNEQAKPKFIPKIVAARYLNNYLLEIQFADKVIKQVDFEPFLKSSYHPEIRSFLEIEKFKQFKIHNGNLLWGDFELIFPLGDIYSNSIMKQVSTF